MSERVFKYQSRIVANWDRVPKVEGRVIKKDKVTIEGKVRPFIMLDTPEGEVQVFESAGLGDLFSALSVGDGCSIEYLATVETKKGRAFRQFRSACWTEDGNPPSPIGKGVSRAKGHAAR